MMSKKDYYKAYDERYKIVHHSNELWEYFEKTEEVELFIEEDIILSPCPLAAYTLFTYGFINKSTYIAATKKCMKKITKSITIL